MASAENTVLIRFIGNLAKGGFVVDRKLLALTLAILVLTGGVVCAHRPIFPAPEIGEPITISNPDVSQALYRELVPGQVDYYEFIVTSPGLDSFLQLLVPTRTRYKDFRPSLALIGPGLPQAKVDMPLEVPAGFGAVIMDWEDKEIFFEPFTQTRYYKAREHRHSLAEGEWQLAVFHRQGQGGKYTLTVGEKEQWSWKDIFRFPGMWFKTRWWYSPAQTVLIILAVLILLVICARLLVRFLKKRT